MELFLISLVGYLLGSVPFAFVIGKLFYKTDVRSHGSGNLGGSNTGRVLGKKAGVAVMTLDILKVTAVVWLAKAFCTHDWAVAAGALAAALGHCYPVFAQFRGGKAVATYYGYLFGLWVCAGYSPLVFFVPLVTFLVVLRLFRIVSVSSMVSSVAAVLCIWLAGATGPEILAGAVFAAVIVVRHRGNLQRLFQGSERRISWM